MEVGLGFGGEINKYLEGGGVQTNFDFRVFVCVCELLNIAK